MRPLWKDLLAGVFMGMILPGVMLNFAVILLAREPTEAARPETHTEPAVISTETVPWTEGTAPLPMRLRGQDGTVREEDMDAYLVGVVLGEMPAYFEPEALKAQAVVARTYTLKAYVTGGKHGDGSVCTQSSCCQAYIPEEDYLARGGAAADVEKVRTAVEATSGYVLTYEGMPIEATYFSCSGGSTEDAAAVWGTDFPYLRSVSSPGEEEAAHYSDTEVFDAAAFCAALGIIPEGAPRDWLGTVTYTAGGGIAEMTIGGKMFTGIQLRQLLGLRSTAITMTAGEDTITVATKGFGHRVGMSQYGADAMAASGSTFDQILTHYYNGTELTLWEADTQ